MCIVYTMKSIDGKERPRWDVFEFTIRSQGRRGQKTELWFLQGPYLSKRKP